MLFNCLNFNKKVSHGGEYQLVVEFACSIWFDTMDLGRFIVWFIVHLNFPNLDAHQSLKIALILSKSADLDEMLYSVLLHLDLQF